MTAKQYFKQKYGTDKNIFTPNVMQYTLTKALAIELSSGRGILNQPIYGVTVIDRQDPESFCKLTNLFQSESQARNYIDRLKRYSKANYTANDMLQCGLLSS